MPRSLPHRLSRISSVLEALCLGQIFIAIACVVAFGCGMFGLLPPFVALLPQLILAWAVTTGLGFILLLAWMHHAAANAAVIAPDARRIGPLWAVIWWFIPVCNLWQPIRCMSQIWNTSVDNDANLNGPAAPPVTLWWILLLAALLALAGTPPERVADWYGAGIAAALSACSAAALITIMRHVTRGQVELTARRMTDQSGTAAGTLPANAAI
jgi:Domain of unknown function (DUF4328)